MKLSTIEYPTWHEPDEAYFSSGAWGSTDARLALTSPRAAADKREGIVPKKESKAFDLGHVWDAYLSSAFQADLGQLFWIRPEGLDLRTKEGKAEKERNAGKPELTHADYAALCLMRKRMPSTLVDMLDAGRSQRVARVAKDGWAQQCKCDLLLDDCVVDFKTTGKPLEEFHRSAINYGYPFQAAWYLDTLNEAMPFAPRKWMLMVTETASPYRTRLFHTTDEWLEYGRLMAEEAHETITRCTQSGNWSDQGMVTGMLDLPKWALSNGQNP
jgi:hypothetical protein